VTPRGDRRPAHPPRELVDVDAVTAFLATSRDPGIALQAATIPGPGAAHEPELAALRARCYADPRLARLFARQGADGSWGAAAEPARRILSTLWLTKAFTEIGVEADHPGLARALDFLQTQALMDGGMSIDGRHDGVLACYTGIIADTMLRAGRPETAAGPLQWITTFQQVRYAGRDYLGEERPVWGDYLKTRYGGCFAGTSCLIGVIKAGVALARAGDEAGSRLRTAMRDLLADRRLFQRRDGTVIPLGAKRDAVRPARERWLLPAFPLSYQTDLLEVAQLAAELGVPDERMAPALDRLATWRLPDGTWPMLRRCSADTWYQPERPAPGAGSYWITLRMLRLHQTLRARAAAPATTSRDGSSPR
jgi:hypothetical protein